MDIFNQIAAKRQQVEGHVRNMIQKSFVGEETEVEPQSSVEEQIAKAGEDELSGVYSELGLEKGVAVGSTENRRKRRVELSHSYGNSMKKSLSEAVGILKAAGNEDIFEKAKHQIGDHNPVYPNLVWTDMGNGKFSWRKPGWKPGNTRKKKQDNKQPSASSTPVSSTPQQNNGGSSVKVNNSSSSDSLLDKEVDDISAKMASLQKEKANAEKRLQMLHKDLKEEKKRLNRCNSVSNSQVIKNYIKDIEKNITDEEAKLKKIEGAIKDKEKEDNKTTKQQKSTQNSSSISNRVTLRKQVLSALQDEFGTNLKSHGNMQGTPVSVSSNKDGSLEVTIGDRGLSVVGKVEKVAKTLNMSCEKSGNTATSTTFKLADSKGSDTPGQLVLAQVKEGRSTPSTLANLYLHNGTQAQIDAAKEQVSSVINSSTDVALVDTTLNMAKKSLKAWADEAKPAWQHVIDECKKRKAFLKTEAGKFETDIFSKLEYYGAEDAKKYFVADSKGLKRKGQRMYLEVETGAMPNTIARQFKQAIAKMEAAGVCHIDDASGHSTAIMLPREK